MNCCHCSRNAFTTINGAAICLSCYRDFESLSNNQISSAYQAQRGTDIAHSMFLRAVVQQSGRQIKNEKNAEVNNYNITVQGNNSGLVQAGKTLAQNNIGINNLSQSSNGNGGLLEKIIAWGIQIGKFCLRLKGLFKI